MLAIAIVLLLSGITILMIEDYLESNRKWGENR